jgi:hypothetical protein
LVAVSVGKLTSKERKNPFGRGNTVRNISFSRVLRGNMPPIDVIALTLRLYHTKINHDKETLLLQ